MQIPDSDEIPVEILYCKKHKNRYLASASCSACAKEAKEHTQPVPRDPPFSGAEYDAKFDKARLVTQMQKIYMLVSDRKWRTLQEISELTGEPHSSVSAQLRNLRKSEFGSHIIDKQVRGDRSKGLYEYKLVQ